MTNKKIAQVCSPFYAVLMDAFSLAWDNVLDASTILGIPNKTERANCMHLAVRTQLQFLCDILDPVLRLKDASGGRGFDYLIVDTGEGQKLALRWGSCVNGLISRNSSLAQREIQEQGWFPFVEDDDQETQMTTASIGYAVANDVVEAGELAGYLSKLSLVRERTSVSEYIHEICVYPDIERNIEEAPAPNETRIIREKKRRALERKADRLRKKLG